MLLTAWLHSWTSVPNLQSVPICGALMYSEHKWTVRDPLFVHANTSLSQSVPLKSYVTDSLLRTLLMSP